MPILLLRRLRGAQHVSETAFSKSVPADAGFELQNAPAPGLWIPSTMPEEAVKNSGKQAPTKRAGQPAELATAYVMLADPLSSYTSGTTVAVTGGKPFI